MKDYVNTSLELHLFFARIMKEHAIFLQAGFMPKNTEYIQEAMLQRGENINSQSIKRSKSLF